MNPNVIDRRNQATIGSVPHPEFDNTQSYSPGDVVMYWGQYWQANRAVSPPLVPSLMSGDVPGSSDAWRDMSSTEIVNQVLGASTGSYYIGSDLISSSFEAPINLVDTGMLTPYFVKASDVLGYYDIGAYQKQMNTLKTVPVCVAMALLKGGQDAINQAEVIANQKSLPGDTDRQQVIGKLEWHQGTLTPLMATPNAIYASGSDLQHWVLQSYIEADAVEAGAAWIDQAWSKMWTDIGTALASLPKEIAKQVGATASDIVTGVTGLPIYAWALIGTGIAGLLGTFVYLLANSKAAGAAEGYYTRGRR